MVCLVPKDAKPKVIIPTRPAVSIIQLIYNHDTKQTNTSVWNTSKHEILLILQQVTARVTADIIQESTNESNGHTQTPKSNARTSSK